MKYILSLLGVLCALCGSISAQDWKQVTDGVEYAEVRREFSGKSVNINLLRLDLKKVRLDVHHALDAAIGTEKTSSIAMRHGAFAAINAGFFRLDTSIWAGDASGYLEIAGSLYSESVSGRCALLIVNWKDDVIVKIERINVTAALMINKKTIPSGINRQRGKDDLVVFTKDFHRTTLTDSDGVEFVVRKNEVVGVFENQGSNIIPHDGFVVSASGKRKIEMLRFLKKGSKIRQLSSASSAIPGQGPGLLGPSLNAVAGVPQLIKNSKIDITWEQEKSSKAFVETRHPRTAVAKLKDGKFLMLTADGRTEQSAGLDLYDLAAYFLELGATDAMNLDGGGSTTMFLDGKVVNKPSDKEGERKVSDAILVTLRKPVAKRRN